MFLSVIIPTKNRSKLLRTTLESLINQDYEKENYEIIVVDNNSTDDTKQTVNLFMQKYPNTRFILESAPGLHNARHTGAKAASGEILLYIDDDIIADKNFLLEIIKPYSDTNVGCVGGKILPKWEINPPDWINLFPKGYLSILDDEKGPVETKWIYGCNFSIRKNLLFEVGGFNPDAFEDKNMWWYRGDGEYGLLRKIHNTGKKIIYNPEAIVQHFIPEKRLTVEYFMERSFKSGLEESFSQYRYNNNSFYLLKSIIHSIIFSIYHFIFKILSICTGKDSIKYKIKASYYKARYLHGFRIAIDKDLRKFIKKESWLK